MGEHTPGPWQRHPVHADIICVPHESISGAIRILGKFDRYREGTWQANVRLVAAAPDLLFALKQMLEEKVDYMTINLLGDPETQHTVKAARAAIAKAEGRT